MVRKDAVRMKGFWEKEVEINLHWRGPHSYNDVLKLNGDSDYGLYQIYSFHPIYGADTLVYIGQANEETFAERFRQPDYGFMSDKNAAWEDNGCRIRIHTGRIHVDKQETALRSTGQKTRITRAERLLIYAHLPAWNSSGIQRPPRDSNFHDVRVLNWGQFGCLVPEVSGARFTIDAVFTRLNDEPVRRLGTSSGLS